jgi:hypothetical protein
MVYQVNTKYAEINGVEKEYVDLKDFFNKVNYIVALHLFDAKRFIKFDKYPFIIKIARKGWFVEKELFNTVVNIIQDNIVDCGIVEGLELLAEPRFKDFICNQLQKFKNQS